MAKVAHDTFEDHQEVEGPSDRSFGLTVGGILLAIALVRWFALDAGATSTAILTAVGGSLFLLAIVRPATLSFFNRAWGKLGLLLAKIVNPIIMALMYVFLFVPIGLVMKLFGRDALKLKRPADENSYWISRAPGGSNPKAMEHQF